MDNQLREQLADLLAAAEEVADDRLAWADTLGGYQAERRLRAAIAAVKGRAEKGTVKLRDKVVITALYPFSSAGSTGGTGNQ